MDQLIDPLRETIATELTKVRLGAARLALRKRLRPRMTATVLMPQAAVGDILPPTDAMPLLKQREQVVEDWLQDFVQRYSAAHWLTLLRRLPRSALSTVHTSEFLQRAKLADVATAHSSRHEPVTLTPRGGLNYHDTADDLADALCWLCAGVRMLSVAQSDIARAEMGATFTLNAQGEPAWQPDSDLDWAIGLYNSRSNPPGAYLSRLGTDVCDVDGWDASPFAVLVSGFDEQERRLRPPTTPEYKRYRAYALHSSFNPHPLAIDRLTLLTRHPLLAAKHWWDSQAAVVLALARFALRRCFDSEDAWNAMLSTGCFALRRNDFIKGIEQIWEQEADSLIHLLPGATWSADRDQMVTVLTTFGGGWQAVDAPPAVRTDGECVLVDLISAWQQLDRMLGFHYELGGQQGQVRGAAFEDYVQEVLIDASNWRPSTKLAEARALTTLRLNGQPLTDLDAAGDRDGTALLVSCKARLFTDKNAQMDANKIWDDQQKLHQYVRKWREVLDTLEANPKGDNYDLRGFTKLVGVVCIPWTPFVTRGPETEEVAPGLRAAISAYELGQWLRKA